jgi:hypothetical protein
MRKFLLPAGIFLGCKAHCQTRLPNLEHINYGDSLKATSYYSTYIGAFDFIISLRGFSAWGSGMTTALAYNKIGWHKIDINTSRFFHDSSKSEITIVRIKKDNGDSLFQILNENHLFDMQDERAKKTTCDSFVLFDGAEYEFEIITKDNYKRLYFYAPEDYYKYCPYPIERKWFINCLKAFAKYLGK